MPHLPALGIRAKIAGLAGALVALIAVVALVSVDGLDKTAQQGHDIYVSGARSIQDVATLQAIYHLGRAQLADIVLEENPAHRAEYVKELQSGGAAFLPTSKRLKTELTTPAAHKLIKQLDAGGSTYVPQQTKVIKLAMAGRTDQARAALEGMEQANADADRLFAALTAEARKAAATGDARATDTYKSARTLVLLLLALGAVAGMGVALLIASGIRRMTAQIIDRLGVLRTQCTTDLKAGLAAMADGDLTVAVEPTAPHITRITRDELGEVAKAVNAIRDNTVASVEAYNESRTALGVLLGDMTLAASNVSEASQRMSSTAGEAGRAVQEIAHAMEHVVEGAERQVHTVSSARERIEEVAQASTRSADEARSTASAAATARAVAGQGSQAVSQATEAMVAVRSASSEATEAIRSLGAKSDEIGGIVDAITNIAEQTNLLALNAAIEAARAGEQGRGFAVVADEVRKLAEESQRAAASIATLIRQIQAETARAVDVVEDGARRTEQGAATVEQAREGFAAIDASVSDMVTRVEGIAAAVTQIADSASAMREEITEVSSVAEQASASSEQVSASTQQTSASTQEIAASAEALAQTASRLDELAARFTIDG